MRRAAKIDANQTEIVDALRKCGASVQSLASVGNGAPDLLVGLHAATFLMEVKTGKGKVRPMQEQWHREWRGDVVWIVRTVDDALGVLTFYAEQSMIRKSSRRGA